MKKPARTYVLQEDEHLENLRKIIKRDFFPSDGKQKQQAIEMSLNNYITNFKSNQNQTFSQLVQSDKQKWKSQHWWIDNQDKLLMLQKQKYLSIKGQSNHYQNMIKQITPVTNMLAITNQQAKNSIFFNKDTDFGSYLGQDHHNAKKINYKNCRLQDSSKKDEQKPVQQQQQANLMTWGSVEGTPLRLPQSEYRMPERSTKDQLLDKLTQKISETKKIEKGRKSELMIKLMGSAMGSYRKSSYVRQSSIRRVDNKQQKKQKGQKDMQGLLRL